MRWVRARVLPEPAPATIRTGPSVWSTASRWTGFSPSRRADSVVSDATPVILGLGAGRPPPQRLGDGLQSFDLPRAAPPVLDPRPEHHHDDDELGAEDPHDPQDPAGHIRLASR